MEHDRAAEIRPVERVVPRDLNFLGQAQGKRIVTAFQFRVDYSDSGKMRSRDTPTDRDPAFDRGNQQASVELRTDRSLQGSRRDNVQVCDRSRAARRRRFSRMKEGRENESSDEEQGRLHAPSVTGRK